MEALMPSEDPQEGKTESLRVPTHVRESLTRAAELAPGARGEADETGFDYRVFRDLDNKVGRT
jgi:hypothetical protein